MNALYIDTYQVRLSSLACATVNWKARVI